MTVRNTVLFTPEGKASPGFFRLWVQRGATQPLQPSAVLLEEDRSATRFFRSLWQVAMTTRTPIPFGPLADEEGRGSDRFWGVFE